MESLVRCPFCRTNNHVSEHDTHSATCPVCHSSLDATYYDILNVGKNASLEDIKKAYRTLSLKWHPDKNPGNPIAENVFISINEAYSTLKQPDKRRRYDDTSNEPQSAFTESQHEMNDQSAMNQFIYEMTVYGIELALQNHDWTSIQRELVLRGCPDYLALMIAKQCEAERKARVRKRALRPFIWGLFWFVLGAVVTIASYNSTAPGDHYTIMGGALLFGGFNMLRALYFLVSGRVPGAKSGKASFRAILALVFAVVIIGGIGAAVVAQNSHSSGNQTTMASPAVNGTVSADQSNMGSAMTDQYTGAIPSTQTPLENWSSVDQTQFQTLLQRVLGGETDEVTMKSFWNLMNKYGYTPSNSQGFKNQISQSVYQTNTYMNQFYNDALTSLQTGQPVVSQNLVNDEQALRAKGLITEQRIQQNRQLLSDIAHRQPVVENGQSVVFTQAMLESAIQNVDQSQENLNTLFSY